MRVEHWELKLNEQIKLYWNQKFQYGKSDCATFVCHVLKAITGVDYYEQFKGLYSTRVGALKVIAKEGSLADLTTKTFGVEVKAPRYAMRGDPVLYVDKETKEECLGICIGHFVIAPRKEGLGTFNLLNALHTWNV